MSHPSDKLVNLELSLHLASFPRPSQTAWKMSPPVPDSSGSKLSAWAGLDSCPWAPSMDGTLRNLARPSARKISLFPLGKHCQEALCLLFQRSRELAQLPTVITSITQLYILAFLLPYPTTLLPPCYCPGYLPDQINPSTPSPCLKLYALGGLRLRPSSWRWS